MKFRLLAWAIAALAVPVTAMAQSRDARPVSYREIAAAYEAQSAELEQLRVRLASLEEQVLTPVPEAVYVDHGMAMGGQDCCTVDCCDACPMFYAGAEMVFLKPHFGSATALSLSDVPLDPAAPDPSVVSNIPFDYDYEISPRFWFGYRNANGTGWRARYWQFDHHVAAEEFAGVFPFAFISVRAPNTFVEVPLPLPTTGGWIETEHRLDLETVDLEITRDIDWGCTVLRVSGGLRYLDMNQHYAACATDGTFCYAMVDYDQHFEGIGPTIAFEVGHELWCCFSIYAHARGSVLFGNRSSRLDGFWAIPTVGTVMHDSPSGDNVLSIGELGLGLEANFGTWFARLGYEGQIWWGAGGPTDSTSDLGLHGFHVTGGLMF